MHIPAYPVDMILFLAATEDGNPLRSLYGGLKDPENIPFIMFREWVQFWIKLILAQFENTPFQVSLEDLAEVLDGEDNPLKMLPEYDLCKNPSYQIPADMVVPKPIVDEFMLWYSYAIGKYIETKQGGNIL
jgi:hypothetical protein